MMKFHFALLALLFTIAGFTQSGTYDILTYRIPEKWTRTTTRSQVLYTTTDKKDKTWCQIIINKSVAGKANNDADFKNDWDELIRPMGATALPESIESREAGNWKIKTGTGRFIFNKSNAITALTTFSANGICLSIVVNMNDTRYVPEIQQFMESLDFKMPVIKTDSRGTVKSGAAIPASGYQFSTTTFDDGWVAVEKSNWVQVSKGNILVLIHYPNPVTSEYITDRDKSVNVAWNNLVAPRYSNLANYYVFNNAMDPESPNFISGNMTDNSSGKPVYVVLFERGKSGWIEFVCPDKASFIKTFSLDQSTLTFYQDMDSWAPLKKMADYNKFAVGAGDLTGIWTNDFTGIQQYVYRTTGQSAGMSSYQSRQVFELSSAKTYKWTLSVASGMVGDIKGKTTRTNGHYSQPSIWQVRFSDISGKPATYDAYFTCIKGARMLWLSNTSYPGYDAYGRKE